jgi:hypothetical protein
MITVKQIKCQLSRVNTGENVDTDYTNLRRLQKGLAKQMLKKSEGKPITTDPATLRYLNKNDFPEGTTIKVRKYRINCERRKTKVWHIDTFQDLKIKDMPLFLREFIGV